ncbi:lipid-A-disaccharide synthase [Thauera linaloolentis]|uniref:Lipid-A-disaccharide synthase n=1 Tax=Thauera linaloolentis (strain DSM 12138 / JCM 21573 / CCUG 41526 / CIP 105981 / IAM 15112 / NBRC 102519 / 47Lol) TaxID=1123367 RepID=N6ZDS0_THAL4|nr:lipid-A-disaccharide synthase [Thauera linaloolentis]ENO90304.1 lipid-A-disaccharide synthase [Thauera linaloolentis 47Lol = DSM 12138]MCM8566207.1 lipid-A-disaccharide synthase [Thauera linaloolentis]
MTIRIAMVAGEASGDLLASHLIRAIRQHLPDAQFFGIGGPKMQAEGFDVRWPCELLAVHGYVDALKRYRELSGIRRSLLAQIRKERPAAFIGVDAPDFNLWLEGKTKEAGIPAIHFVSPSIWAWRGGRIKRIARSVSRMLCLFPFESELYERAGVPVSYVGHPLADVFPLCPDRAAARALLGLGHDRRVVAMLPGSRQSEVRNLADTYIATACRMLERDPALVFLVPLATRETRAIFEEALHRKQATELPIRMLFGHAVEAMTAADAVLVASGTASLEAALLKRPMVITYRIGDWQYRLMKRMAYLPWVGLPNILCNESLVPELLQDEATPDRLAAALEDWLGDADRCAALEFRFTELHLALRQDTAQKAAEAILPYLGGGAA